MNTRQIVLLILLSLIGLTVWIVIGKLTHKVEAWDSMYYYFIGLPLMCITCAIAGYLEPKNSIAFGFAVVILQPAALLFQTEPGPMILVGILFFLVFAAMTVGCAF